MAGWGEGGSWSSLNELSSNADSLSRSVFLKELWNEKSKIIGGNSDVEVFGEKSSDIKVVSSKVSSLKDSVDGVVSEVELERWTLGVAEVELGGVVLAGLNLISIESSAVDCHHEV